MTSMDIIFHSYQSKLNFIAEGSSNILVPKYVEALHRDWLQNWKKKKKKRISAFESASYSQKMGVQKMVQTDHKRPLRFW